MASKKSKTVAAETVAPAEQPTTTLEPVQLTIADLQMLSRVVDLASRRGAFQANELSQVGEAFNKLSSFLAYVEQAQAKEAEATAGTTAAEEAAA